MKRKIRIVIGFFVAIPTVLVEIIWFNFLPNCRNEFEGWLIDRAAEKCRKRSTPYRKK